MSERSESIILGTFGSCITFSIPLVSFFDEKQRVYDYSKKSTFQSDPYLDSGFSQVCGGLLIFLRVYLTPRPFSHQSKPLSKIRCVRSKLLVLTKASKLD